MVSSESITTPPNGVYYLPHTFEKKIDLRGTEHVRAGKAQTGAEAGPGTKSVVSLPQMWHPNLVQDSELYTKTQKVCVCVSVCVCVMFFPRA